MNPASLLLVCLLLLGMAVKHFKINGIDEELIDRFMDFSNENQDHEWRILLNSTGGGSETADWLAWQLNSHPLKVTVAASVGIYSSAFSLFYKVRRHRQMVNGCVGMYHLPTRSFTKDPTGRIVYNEHRVQMDSLKKSLQDPVAEAVFTQKERRKWKKGEDVYFSFDRMKEIFPAAEIIL